jgi:hypothetical protein
VHALGRPLFISDQLFRRLIDEARREHASSASVAPGRAIATASETLAALAASRQLRECVANAVGFAVTPTYRAVYEYDAPGSHVHTHLDGRGYDIVFHLLLEHGSAAGGDRDSTLLAHMADESSPVRVRLRVGEALVLLGRGTLHSWRALGDDETRMLTAIGFRRAH